ncbi:hypothetical protein K402DRAFT_140024 [Aulographum hederae CBS 113979]|uniref:Uncharacterized protein n=1 Tax=Aulographum hederae CBS 113979 TaxID=1176131 RepID=A0A6G1GUX8_9PEZI|nr:hypothetical protein K402DRAFT_140024 [Aulographum hederae CBS 113979]
MGTPSRKKPAKSSPTFSYSAPSLPPKFKPRDAPVSPRSTVSPELPPIKTPHNSSGNGTWSHAHSTKPPVPTTAKINYDERPQPRRGTKHRQTRKPEAKPRELSPKPRVRTRSDSSIMDIRRLRE